MAKPPPPPSSLSSLYRRLPSITELDQALRDAGLPTGRLVRPLQQAWLDRQRQQIPLWHAADNLPDWLTDKPSILAQAVADCSEQQSSRLTRVINATGVVLHTNLGRAPLAESVWSQAQLALTSYADVEFALDTGERGQRMQRVQQLLSLLSGAKDALVVNNNAAAVFLLLKAVCAHREVLVSRGELVEIGGSFRVPDILREAGVTLVEVGTTNRTRLRDYQEAMTENTVAVLKVHPSNYVIRGFTEEVSLAELTAWARTAGLYSLYDWGSGTFYRFQHPQLQHVPTVQEELASGVDVLCFSGDKLLGGPQAGILLGSPELLTSLRKHPLYRTFRLDKGTLALLELTLRVYAEPETARRHIPTLDLLERTPEDLDPLVESVLSQLAPTAHFTVQKSEFDSLVGGGGLPDVRLPSVGLSIQSAQVSPQELQRQLRQGAPPVIVNVRKGAIHLDLRTVFASQLGDLLSQLQLLVST